MFFKDGMQKPPTHKYPINVSLIIAAVLITVCANDFQSDAFGPINSGAGSGSGAGSVADNSAQSPSSYPYGALPSPVTPAPTKSSPPLKTPDKKTKPPKSTTQRKGATTTAEKRTASPDNVAVSSPATSVNFGSGVTWSVVDVTSNATRRVSVNSTVTKNESGSFTVMKTVNRTETVERRPDDVTSRADETEGDENDGRSPSVAPRPDDVTDGPPSYLSPASCYSSQPDPVRFHEAVGNCSRLRGQLASINESLPADQDPVRELFERWYGDLDRPKNTIQTPRKFAVWMLVIYSEKQFYDYVYLRLTKNYMNDRATAIRSVWQLYDDSGKRFKNLSPGVGERNLGSYSCALNNCGSGQFAACREPYVLHRGRCYHLSGVHSYLSAPERCLRTGGTLAKLSDSDDNMPAVFLMAMGHSLNIAQRFFIGMQMTFLSSRIFHIDGEEFYDPATSVKQPPTNEYSKDLCFAMDIQEFKYYPTYCREWLPAFCILQDPPCRLNRSIRVFGECVSKPGRGSLCTFKNNDNGSYCPTGTNVRNVSSEEEPNLYAYMKSASCIDHPCNVKTFDDADPVCICGL